MFGFEIIDIEDERYADGNIDFVNQHLLNRVQVLSVYFHNHQADGDYWRHFRRNAALFFGDLTSFLCNTTQRIERIEIHHMPDLVNDDRLPEYRAFLSSSFSIADSIDACDCFFGEIPLACFMAGLCHMNSPKRFSVSFDESTCSNEALRMISLGVGASRSLEHFEIGEIEIEVDEFGFVEGLNSISNALRQNKSLKLFSITMATNLGYTAMLQVALAHPKLEVLTIKLGENEIESAIRSRTLEILEQGLCRSDCILKELRLNNLRQFPSATTREATNTSVRALALTNTCQRLSTVMKVVQMFKSLEHLDISQGYFLGHDLAVLDELLLSDTARLESLCMSQCYIEEESMMAFVQKLDRMKKLKYLIVRDNPFAASEACVAALKEALWKNTSLEFVSMGSLPPVIAEKLKLPLDIETLTDSAELSSFEMLPLHLNQAGRAKLLNNSQDLEEEEANLVPRILEQSGKLDYYTTSENENVQKDVTFWFLRHLLISQLS